MSFPKPRFPFSSLLWKFFDFHIRARQDHLINRRQRVKKSDEEAGSWECFCWHQASSIGGQLKLRWKWALAEPQDPKSLVRVRDIDYYPLSTRTPSAENLIVLPPTIYRFGQNDIRHFAAESEVVIIMSPECRAILLKVPLHRPPLRRVRQRSKNTLLSPNIWPISAPINK